MGWETHAHHPEAAKRMGFTPGGLLAASYRRTRRTSGAVARPTTRDRFAGPSQTPFAQLVSDLFASIGWLAERSQRPKVDDGMIDDVQAFAVYALFYDAFSVDRRFAHVLRTSPMTDRLPSDTAIFASNELHLLESWLLDVETRTPAGHFDLAASMARLA